MSALGNGSYNGLAFGPGTKFNVTGIVGWDDGPAVRTDDEARPTMDGEWSGQDLANGRSVVMTFGLRGDDPDDLAVLVQLARQAFAPGVPLQALTIRNGAETVFAKPRKRSVPYEAAQLDRLGEASVEFYCPDPRIYGPLQTSGTGLAGVLGGFGFPLAFPFGFGGTGVSGGTAFMPNSGFTTAYPVFTISAPALPLTSPSIEQIGVGIATFDLTLNPGDVLVIDSLNRTVILNGQVSRRSSMRVGSPWPTLPPGGASYRFGSAAYTADATLSVTARSAVL